MFISSIDPKSQNTKLHSSTNTRSHSSLSAISLKATMTGKNSKNNTITKFEHPEVSQLSQLKKGLESKILLTVFEMKKLKTVSKNLRKKENDLKALQDSLIKSNEDLIEARIKLERSGKILTDICGLVKNGEDEKLFEMYPSVCKHIVRLRQKRNSLIIDDLVLGPGNGSTIHTARDFKVRSPYFSGGTNASTPKLRKVRVLKCESLKSTPKLDKLITEKQDLATIHERLKVLLSYLQANK